MPDFESNYPRSSGPPLAIERLKRITYLGTGLAYAYSFLVLFFILVIRNTLLTTMDARFVSMYGKTEALTLVLLGLVACTWIHLALTAIQSVPNNYQWKSSTSEALSCFISGFLLFIPLSLTMDSLLARSEGKGVEPMKWYRPISNYQISNLFFYTLASSILFDFVLLATHSVRSQLTIIPGLLLVTAVLTGSKIAGIVNENLTHFLGSAH